MGSTLTILGDILHKYYYLVSLFAAGLLFCNLAGVIIVGLANCRFFYKSYIDTFHTFFAIVLVHSGFMFEVSNTVAEQSKDERDIGNSVPAAAAAGRDSVSVITGRHSSSDVIHQVEEDTERSCDVCVGRGKRDHVIVFTTRLFTQLYT